MATVLDREEQIEQAYFFRVFRERMITNAAAQEVLDHLHQEILSTTRLPYAIQFLATELKHAGLLASGFERLAHYFTPFQAFVVRMAEQEGQRFSMPAAMLVLEREAQYKAGEPTPSGLFVYQFEAIARNRLGYDEGLTSMAGEPLFDADWRAFLEMIRRQGGTIEFSDLVYLRSEQYVQEQRRLDPDYQPPLPALFGAKEGKIAKANRGRDPLYLFAAMQRQLGYPEVPRPRPREDGVAQMELVQLKMRELEQRIKLVEGEIRGQVDWSQFGKPDLLTDPDDEEKI